MTLCHCDKDPAYEAKARFEPTVTLDVTPLREPGEWQPEHLADIDLDGPVKGLVVECTRCGWTEDLPTLVEVGELDWPERLVEILSARDPEPNAWELLERMNALHCGPDGKRVGVVPDMTSEDTAWVCGIVHRHTYCDKWGMAPTPEAAIRAAWDAVQGGEVGS